MNTDDFHTTALERAVVALLSEDASTLKDICERINQPQLNLCLVPTALSSSVDCLKIVVGPLKGLYDSSQDCLNLLASESVDEERLKVLLSLSNPAAVHSSTQHTLWSIGLLLKLPCSFYQDWNPDNRTVAEALVKMKDCEDLELLHWCVKKVSKMSVLDYIHPAWEAAQQAKNFPFLNILASNFTCTQRWIGEIHEKWDVWETQCEVLTHHPSLAALVVSAAIEKNNWAVVHALIRGAEKNPIVTETCLATQNIFICNWIFSQEFFLSPQNLWHQICCPEDRRLEGNALAFFNYLLECDKKWSMGAWESLKQECGASQLFCQLLMHSEQAADIARSEVDPAFSESLPLRLACLLGREQTVTEMLPHSDPFAHDSQALALAAINGHAHVMKQLIPHSNPTANGHRALACALWFDSQGNTDQCSSLLITSETSPEKTAEIWRKQINQTNSDKISDHELFGSLADPMEPRLIDIFSEWEDANHVTPHKTPQKEAKQVYQIHPMSWVNFDHPIENWWSSLTGSDLTKIGRHLAKMFPEALKKYLCDVNQKDPARTNRKI